MLKPYLNRLLERKDLTPDEMSESFRLIMTQPVPPAQIAGFLIALRLKGESSDEMAAAARTMRHHAVRITPKTTTLVDTCGTGGDGQHSFNISTAAALVVAAAGVPVAKHGNRAVSSRCGSADLLLALGINPDVAPEKVRQGIEEWGFGFLFAPRFHPAMKAVMPVRKELGVRTIFNLLGPLTNPAGTTVQTIGVYHHDLVEKIAHVACLVGLKACWVVHSEDGLDELSICAPTTVGELLDGTVRTFSITPEEVGMRRYPPGSLRGGTPKENRILLENIFSGKKGAHRDAVLLTAGATLFLAARAEGNPCTIPEGISRAGHAVDSGQAREKLTALQKFYRT